MSGPGGPRSGKSELADRDRLRRRSVLEQRLQLRPKIDRLEPLAGRGDLGGTPPAMAERPAALALVEARGVDLSAVGAAEEKAFAMQHVLAAPAHASFALPDPAHRSVDHDRGLLARFAHGGVCEILAGVDEAADHDPKRIEMRVGGVEDARI